MGRETKILLAILGLLAGVFMGVVSLKLFVPRPPAGTGPDVHVESEPLPLVDPPSLEAPSFETPAMDHDHPYATRSSRFAAPAGAGPQNPVVAPASYEVPAELTAPSADDPSAEPVPSLLPIDPPAVPVMSVPIEPPARSLSPPSDHEPVVTSPPNGPIQGGTYETRDGDSWWSLAEHAYGDGRLYRALYAWNRSLDSRVSLVPGTHLDIPPAAKLGAAWSTLLPTD